MVDDISPQERNVNKNAGLVTTGSLTRIDTGPQAAALVAHPRVIPAAKTFAPSA